MSYIVFARKYRPQTFDDVIGQSHITTTLKNAISQSRVAHAYIFAGPRGVGKTTTARILAKALNCEKGPAADPCNACASCVSITQGSSLDILEIDGASNRGIEEIRSLRENIKFAPSAGRFKIYIIDEVHMLTGEAFNALLKTLEEPPPHVKFIFATTSLHKVPATILSRCQRFDFRRIAAGDLLANLRMIARDQRIDVSDEALAMIARYGDGSMRNAQVILDQMASFGSGRIGAGDVAEILGVVGDDLLFGISEAIRSRDAGKGLSIIAELVDSGKDPSQVVLGLIEHFRNISVAKICESPGELIDAAPEKVERYRAEAGLFSIEEILYIIYTLSNTLDFMRKSQLARIPFEAAIVKLTQIPSVLNLAQIAERIESLERSAPQAAARTAPQPAPDAAVPPVSGPRQDVRKAKPKPADAAGAPPPQALSETGAHVDVQTAVGDPPAPTGTAADLDEVAGCWAKVVSYIMPKKISIASYLQEGYPSALAGNVLTISFPKECQFHKEVLESPENRRVIEEAIKEVAGMELRVALALAAPEKAGRPGGFAAGAGVRPDSGTPSEAGPDAQDDSDPIVRTALNIFNGHIAGGGPGRSK